MKLHATSTKIIKNVQNPPPSRIFSTFCDYTRGRAPLTDFLYFLYAPFFSIYLFFPHRSGFFAYLLASLACKWDGLEGECFFLFCFRKWGNVIGFRSAFRVERCATVALRCVADFSGTNVGDDSATMRCGRELNHGLSQRHLLLSSGTKICGCKLALLIDVRL